MKHIKVLSIIVVFLFTLTSCSVKPKKINYGEDNCHYCEMTIVDKTHVSEYVTKKGKSYKFDSIECMIRELNKRKNNNDLAYVLVANFNKPGKLINANKATYIVTKAIRSPMLENLSAFNSKEEGTAAQKKYGGNLFTWQEIKNKIRTK